MGKAAAKRGVDIGIDSTVLQGNYGNAATIDFRFAATVMAAVGAKETPANATTASPMAYGRSRYETGKELGAGGMGRVVEALDHQFGRSVALKEMLPGALPASLIQRFVTESVVTANLEHPGIPAVHERGVDDAGRPFYVMRKVTGETLSEAIHKARRLADRLAFLPAIVKVAQTLAHAHERGVVHRDVKPDNVILGKHGEVILLDWGIAKVRGIEGATDIDSPISPGQLQQTQQTQQGVVMGTPAYMAPEQAVGNASLIDERTDVFAVGALLYHILTGRAPYTGETTAAIVAQAYEAQPPAIASLEPKAPVALQRIAQRAMAKDMGDRYRTAGDLAQALEAVLSGALTEEHARWIQGFANVAGGGAFVLALGCAFWMWRSVVSFHELGWPAFVIVAAAVVGTILGAMEWKTAGRYALSSLVVAFAITTVLSGVSGALIGQATVFTAINKHNLATDGPRWRMIITAGTRESMGNVVVGAELAAPQLFLWALARRRTILAKSRTT